jgi:uncharacterized protein GlcG (DUF336 family)
MMGKLKTLVLGTTVSLGSVSTAFAQQGGPTSGLTAVDAKNIFNSCQTTAKNTTSTFGRKAGTIMWCAVLDREGQTLLIEATDTGESPGPNLKTDAWRASIEIAEAKAYTALSLSSNDLALDSRTVGLNARTDAGGSGKPGTDTGPAPLFGIGVGSEEAPIEGLASVRRSNGTCSFPAFRFHECPHEI